MLSQLLNQKVAVLLLNGCVIGLLDCLIQGSYFVMICNKHVQSILSLPNSKSCNLCRWHCFRRHHRHSIHSSGRTEGRNIVVDGEGRTNGNRCTSKHDDWYWFEFW